MNATDSTTAPESITITVSDAMRQVITAAYNSGRDPQNQPHARLEIRPCIKDPAGTWIDSGTPITDEEAQFFGIYHVSAEGFSDHILDQSTREEAETITRLIAEWIDRKIENPGASLITREYDYQMVDVTIRENGKPDAAIMFESAATACLVKKYIEDEAKRQRIEAYEERQEEKRDRYAELATKHAAASTAAYNGVRQIMDAIPPGQPILVDHYSAKYHRRAIERMDRGMAASVSHRDTAAYYADKAENYGTHGISAADPAALDKLRAELAALETANENAKAINRHYRKTGSLDNCPVEISPTQREQIERVIRDRQRYGLSGSSVLGTNAPEIKRIRDRIAGLEKNLERGHLEKEYSFGTYEEDPNENRANFYFDGKPDDATRNILKRNGFKWSPSRHAWTRILNNAARCSARAVIKALGTSNTAAAV